MENGSESEKRRKCPTCNGSLEDVAAVCPCCGSPTLEDSTSRCVVVRGGQLDQDAVVTPARRIVEKATVDGMLTEDQGEFLLDLMMRVRPLHFDRRMEFAQILTEIARESVPEKRRKALWALRGRLRDVPALEDAVHALFVKFEL